MSQQYLIVAVIEVDEPQLSNIVAASSYVERLLMGDGTIINRCKVIATDETAGKVISWGENDDRIFTANPILPEMGYNT
jgi:hypothetical protein